MKVKHILFIALSIFFLVEGCGKNNTEPAKQVFEVSGTTLSFSVDGGTSTLTIKSSSSWQYSANAAWVSVTPPGRAGSDTPVEVSITAGKNNGDERTATITFTSGSLSKTVNVTQEGVVDDGIPRVTIKEFRNKKDSSTDWYRLTGEVVSIANSQYGDLYIMDETGYIYVYGLAAGKGGDNAKEYAGLGIKAGDIITIVANKKTYNSIIETDAAYLENKESGSYPGFSAAKATAGWLELPQTSGEDAYDYLCHLDKDGKRNYSIYYDKAARVARWVAYPYTSGDKNSSGRSDAYAYDPLVGEKDQPSLSKSSYSNSGTGLSEDRFVRGHMVPSYDRGGRRNIDVFLTTNIMPQSEELNTGTWGDLEDKVRSLSYACDTLYIVIGTVYNDASIKVKDNNNLDITVPDGIYKAVLAYSQNFGYKGLGAYFTNRKSDANAELKSKCMSIDELEKKTGVDFFVNLPDDIEKEIEAKNPTEDSWWNF